MLRQKVESSNLVSVGYDPASRVLEVEFKGGSIYQYSDCPASLFKSLQDAESKGSFFSKNIKSTLVYKKVFDGNESRK